MVSKQGSNMSNDRALLDLSIVIPSYNERNRIFKTLDAYTSFFDTKKIRYEIIVADISTDGSKELIRKYQKKHKNVVVLDIKQRGKGLAVFEGFKISKGKLLSFTDADNATPPPEFFKLYGELEGFDAAIGSRGMRRSKVVNYHQSFFRRLGSFVLGVVFVYFIFGLHIHDTQCGAKIFRREKILKVLPKMRITNSIFDIELLWRFSKIGKINEVPIKWVDDNFSHFRWSETISEFFWLLRVRFGL
ncbi:MAG: glycosyltransferase [Candidatus Altiarchaeota archaeon]|nr:glycosyltransferase [Candidatus Altiarchaeota archaeon]